MTRDTERVMQAAQAAVTAHLGRVAVTPTWQSQHYATGDVDVVIDVRREAWGVAWQVAAYGQMRGTVVELCVCWCLDGGAAQMRGGVDLTAHLALVVAALGAVSEKGGWVFPA